MSTSTYITAVVPIFNEEDTIPELHERLSKSLKEVNDAYQIIYINDGSRDRSLEKLKTLSETDSHVKFISFSRNFGHQIAVSAGLDFVQSQVTVIIDGDLQDPPELIPELHEKYQEGYKVVYARRKSRKGEGWFKKFTAKWFYRILGKITSVDIPVDTGDFRLIDRQVVDQLRSMQENNKFLRGQIAWIGFSQTYVLFDRDARKHGETGYPFKKMLGFAIDGITGFSTFPLKLASFLGFFVSFLALLVIIFSIVSKYIFEKTIDGWTSLMVSIMFIGGIQLFMIGILGEYLGRINDNVRSRPLYIIDQTNCDKGNEG